MRDQPGIERNAVASGVRGIRRQEHTPFLTKPNARRQRKDLPGTLAENAPGIAIEHNPGVALVYVCLSYRPISDHRGGTLFELGAPTQARFYCEGRPATRAEVLASIDKGLLILQDMANSEGREAVAELDLRTRKAMELVPA